MTKLDKLIKEELENLIMFNVGSCISDIEKLAKKYAYYCCRQQKKICSQHAGIQREFVLNAPTFKEDGK